MIYSSYKINRLAQPTHGLYILKTMVIALLRQSKPLLSIEHCLNNGASTIDCLKPFTIVTLVLLKILVQSPFTQKKTITDWYFHSARVGIALNNYNGFSFIEIMMASILALTILLTIVPIATQLQKERAVLNERLNHIELLHDQLQQYILNPPITLPSEVSINDAHLTFQMDDKLLKGCIKWENAKLKQEKECLYGIIEK